MRRVDIILWCWETERAGERGIASFTPQISSDEWHQHAPVVCSIYSQHCTEFLQNRTKAVFQWSWPNGTNHSCQLLDLWIYIGRQGTISTENRLLSTTEGAAAASVFPGFGFSTVLGLSPGNCCLRSIGLKLMDLRRSNLINEYPRGGKQFH